MLLSFVFFTRERNDFLINSVSSAFVATNLQQTLREKYPNTEFFLVRVQSEYEKIRTRKTPYLDTLHTVKAASFRRKSCLNSHKSHKSFLPAFPRTGFTCSDSMI